MYQKHMPVPRLTIKKMDEMFPTLAEQSVIEAILVNPELISKIKTILPTADSFSDEAWHDAYRVMLLLNEKNIPIDIITIRNSGFAFPLSTLVNAFVLPDEMHFGKRRWEYIGTHAQIIKEAYLRRQIALAEGDTGKLRDVILLAAELTKRGEDRIFKAREVA